MKLNIDFLQTGGVPLTNDLMRDVMDAISIYDTLGTLAGNLTILSGCEPVSAGSTTYTPGVVAIEGEVLIFEGGINAGTVYIHEEEIYKTFQDQTDKILIRKKTVKFGNALQTYNWADFVKLDTIKEIMAKANAAATQQQLAALQAEIDILKLKTAPIINDGIILAWNKPASEIPQGWKECLDTKGKTLVHQDPNDTYFSTLGANVGEKVTKLTQAHLPNVKLKMFTSSWAGNYGPNSQNAAIGISVGGYQNYFISGSSGSPDTYETSPLGSGLAHNNVQPSRIVLFIEPNFQ